MFCSAEYVSNRSFNRVCENLDSNRKKLQLRGWFVPFPNHHEERDAKFQSGSIFPVPPKAGDSAVGAQRLGCARSQSLLDSEGNHWMSAWVKVSASSSSLMFTTL